MLTITDALQDRIPSGNNLEADPALAILIWLRSWTISVIGPSGAAPRADAAAAALLTRMVEALERGGLQYSREVIHVHPLLIHVHLLLIHVHPS